MCVEEDPHCQARVGQMAFRWASGASPLSQPNTVRVQSLLDAICLINAQAHITAGNFLFVVSIDFFLGGGVVR